MFHRISQFISDVKGELRKVSWPWDTESKTASGKIKGFKELTDSTLVVLVAMVLLAAYVSLNDVLLVRLMGAIMKLGR